ncbi:MAG: TIGR00295 family protein [Methanolobus sp.]|nr:TIGR00295 family protein [Methanolobus sp.]
MISRDLAIGILRDSGCSEKVIEHCIAVAQLALEIAQGLKAQGRDVNMALVEVGGLLHDIGRAKSHGMDHAIAGAKIAADNGIDPEVIEIIKRHIGAGITSEEAKTMGLPEDDYMPVTLEQKIVAHADNLIKGTERISLESRIRKMREKNFDIAIIERTQKLAGEIGIY